MQKYLPALISLFIATATLSAQTVTLPAEIKGAQGAWIAVTPVVDGGVPGWRYDKGLVEVDVAKELGAEAPVKQKGKVFTAASDGRYVVEVWCAKGDKVSEIARTVIVVGDGKPAVKPELIPLPKPDPVLPPPIPGPGFSVLIIEETLQRAKLTPGQRAVLSATDASSVRALMQTTFPDGSKPRFAIFDQGASLTNASDVWKNAMKRERKSLPWIIVSNGVTGFEGPLPATAEESLALIKKYRDTKVVPTPTATDVQTSDINARILWWQQNRPEFLTKP